MFLLLKDSFALVFPLTQTLILNGLWAVYFHWFRMDCGLFTFMQSTEYLFFYLQLNWHIWGLFVLIPKKIEFTFFTKIHANE